MHDQIHMDAYPHVHTARSREDKTRKSHRNAKQNPIRNQESIVVGLLSNFQMQRDLER